MVCAFMSEGRAARGENRSISRSELTLPYYF
jgi:hypothetical protein